MRKLYVIVRSNLSKSQQAVQAGHALAEWLLFTGSSRRWDNGTLVYLKVRDLEELTNLKNKMDEFEQWPVAFHEPDIGNEMTAFSMLETEHVSAMDLLKNLPLL